MKKFGLLYFVLATGWAQTHQAIAIKKPACYDVAIKAAQDATECDGLAKAIYKVKETGTGPTYAVRTECRRGGSENQYWSVSLKIVDGTCSATNIEETSDDDTLNDEPTAQISGSNDQSIYGWDVHCLGADGLTVNASQADDDFYIEYESQKIKGEVWADSTNQLNSMTKNLVFMTLQSVSHGPEATLSVVRRNANGFGSASGVFLLDRTRYELNCDVRYGISEDDFSAISDKPYPKITPPKK